MFPQYSSFLDNPWNKSLLTAREHFIAHWMLCKAYPNIKSFMDWMKKNNTNIRREYWNIGVVESVKSKKHEWLIGHSVIVS